MNKDKQVTILLATLNKVATIRDCIESLLNVNYPVSKILVLDGGSDGVSNDGTLEILKKYQGRIDLIQKPVGHSEKMNWALDNTETEYIAMTDADCVVEPDWLTKLLASFDQEENIGICEMLKPTGNMKETNYNLIKFYEKCNNRFQNPKKCACSHDCNIMSSIRFSPKSLTDMIKMKP